MKIGIFDATTQENTVRDMTAEELADYETRNAEAKAKEDALEAAAAKAVTDKAALLAKLGITADEAKLLLS